ncbi:MAG: hypothetical protein NVS4B10_01030 [Myxococcales bacterium]
MAVLLNQTSNLRLRLDLLGRLSDGVLTPASLRMSVAIERYAHAGKGGGEHGFAPMVAVPQATLLDLDLIQFLQDLEELLARALPAPGTDPYAPPAPDGPLPAAALEASVDPAIGLRIAGGPEAYQVEVGIDLLNLLETVGGLAGERSADLSLFRFAANGRAVVAFCAALIADFQKYPTDPGAVHKGEAG